MNRKSIIKTTNKSNDKSYYGLVVNCDDGFVTAIKLTNNNRIAKNESLSVIVNGEQYFVNVFSSPFTVKENNIDGIIGEVNDITYFTIISSVINVYMGFWHIDEDGCQILDPMYVKSPISAMLFGGNTIEFFNESIINEKDNREVKAQRRKELEFKTKVNNIRPFNRATKRTEIARVLEEENVFSLPTTQRVDMLYRLFDVYTVGDKLDVVRVHRAMFMDAAYHTTKAAIKLNKNEFMFILNSPTDAIANEYGKTKNMATIIRRYVMDVFHCKKMPKQVILGDSIVNEIKQLRANGVRFREIMSTIYDTHESEFVGYQYQSVLKAVKNAFRTNNSNNTSVDDRHSDMVIDINKHIDRLTKSEWFQKSTYWNEIHKLIVSNINDPEIIDGSKTINHESPYVRCMVMVAIYSNYNVAAWPEFLVKPINRDIVDWLNSIDYQDFCDIGYDGATNAISSSNKFSYRMLKIVSHYLTISDEEKKKLHAAVVSGKLEDFIYPLCGSFGTSGKYHSWLFQFISDQTGIDVKTFQTASDMKKYIHILHIK